MLPCLVVLFEESLEDLRGLVEHLQLDQQLRTRDPRRVQQGTYLNNKIEMVYTSLIAFASLKGTCTYDVLAEGEGGLA